ncbi:hypothetical protein HDV02_000463 [Globomyces sp. JEL0801]|nr:hypothetical protein HDV02_000463 [Globomyces sp. JEL0801]
MSDPKLNEDVTVQDINQSNPDLLDQDTIQVQVPVPAPSSSRLMCRMYEERFPEVETCVMVNVRQITDIGTYVHLLEYNNIEGMILLSELTRRRIRSIQKLVRIGKNEVAVVMRVDKEKGYIDLSKRRATPEDIAECEERYNKSKAVHSIMRHVADRVNMDLEELYTLYCWPLYKQYGHAYEAFKMVIVDPDSVLNTLDIPEHIKKELVNGIRRRLTPQPIKIRADVECSCFGYEGIDAVKAALTAGEQCSTEDVNIKPRAVSESDEAELQKLMDKMEQENKEVVVGSGGVGKSCLTVRFLKDEFTSEYDPTVEENYRKNVTVDNAQCTAYIIDTAGQHEYKALRDQHLKDGKGFLLVFALNDKSSLEEVKEIREQIIKLKETRKVPFDLPADQKEVDLTAAQTFFKEFKIPILETSAKENINVSEAFDELVRECRRLTKPDKAKPAKAAKKKGGCVIL